MEGVVETRLQLRVEPTVLEAIELIATALNPSSIKLAGLMVEHSLDEDLILKIMKTWPGKLLRKAWRGKEDEAYESRIAQDADQE